MTKDAAPQGDERVAFTLRLDPDVLKLADTECDDLSRRLGVKVSRNEFFARLIMYYLVQTPASRLWMPPVPAPEATNGRKKVQG